MIVLDAGMRVNKVRNAYKDKQDWQREFATQTSGFGAGAAVGIATGRATTAIMTSGLAAGLTAIGLALGPVGWLVIIGTSVAAGYYAGKLADNAMQNISGAIYDRNFKRNF